MRAFQLPKGGAGIDAIVNVDRPRLQPAYRQVLVKVAACSLNYRDLGIARGSYRMPVRDNIVPLSDGAGKVTEVGPGVTRLKVGDRVAGCFFQRWVGGRAPGNAHASALGGGIDGMLTEYVVLEEDGVVKLPEHLSLEEGATLPCAALTAWNALVEHGRLIAGQSVLLLGTGGVSVFGLQLARMMGLQAIITSSSDEKLVRAKKLGAHHGVNYKSTPEWDKAVIDATGGGVDHVVEVGGAGTLARSIGALRTGGKVTLIGGLSGTTDLLNPGLLMGRRAELRAISVGSTEMFEAMNRAITVSGLKPVIDRVFPFGETLAAYKYMASGAHFGKIVISLA